MYQTKENGTIQSLPYDKFLQQGAENLTEEELIAIILRTGTRGEDALTLACRVLSVCDKRHGILGLHHVTLDQLMQVKGIGLVKAVKLKAIAELSPQDGSCQSGKGCGVPESAGCGTGLYGTAAAFGKRVLYCTVFRHKRQQDKRCRVVYR